jgi:hypothetical protein
MSAYYLWLQRRVRSRSHVTLSLLDDPIRGCAGSFFQVVWRVQIVFALGIYIWRNHCAADGTRVTSCCSETIRTAADIAKESMNDLL